MTPEERLLDLRRRQIKARLSGATQGSQGQSAEMQQGMAALSDMTQNPAVQDDPGGVRSAVIGGAQGVTFGFADEMAARVLSLHPEIDYDTALDYLQQEIASARANRPGTTAAAEIAGAIASPVARVGAGFAAGGATLGGQMARGAAVGAAQGAAYGAGSADQGERLQGAAVGGVIGGAVGGAVPVAMEGARRAVGAVQNARATKRAIAAAPQGDDLRRTASRLYSEADQAAPLPRADFATATQSIMDRAERAGMDADLTPGAAKVADRMTDAATDPSAGIGFRELDILRKKAAVPAGNFQNRTEQSLGSQMIQGIDDFVDNADPALAGKVKEARELWGVLRRSELVEAAIDKAKNTASGFENGLRIEFRKILSNPKLLRGFSEAEVKAIKTVVQGTPLGNLMRQLGKVGLGLSGQSNGLGATIGAIGGTAVGGPVGGLAVVAGGTALKALAERTTRKSAERALATVSARPAIQALPQVTQSPAIGNALSYLPSAAAPAYNALIGLPSQRSR